MEQAYRVIGQVNAASGVEFDDGRTPEQCLREVVKRVEDLDSALAGPTAWARSASAESSITPLAELHEAVRHCLRLCRQP